MPFCCFNYDCKTVSSSSRRFVKQKTQIVYCRKRASKISQVNSSDLTPEFNPPAHHRHLSELMSVSAAVSHLIEYLDRNKDRIHRSLRYVRTYLAQLGSDRSVEEALRFIVAHCRDEVFDNTLAGTQIRTSKSLEPSLSGTASKLGLASPPLRIRLNQKLTQSLWERRSARDDLVALVLHHFIHAYLLTKCGAPRTEQEHQDVLGHGAPFSALMYKIKDIAYSATIVTLPMTAGFPLVVCQDNLWFRRHLPTPSIVAEGHGCTHLVRDMNEDIVRQWTKSNCLLLPPNTRIFHLEDGDHFTSKFISEYPDRHDLLLIKWSDKYYILPKLALRDINGLSALFRNSLPFALPKSVSEEQIKLFIQYCRNKAYGPSLQTSQKAGGSSPPLILPPKSNSKWPPVLLLDIQMFQLGVTIKLQSLQELALMRLKSHHFSHEDPIKVLEAIFRITPPHYQLIDWVKMWVRRVDDVRPGDMLIRRSNWAIITRCATVRELLAQSYGREVAALLREAEDEMRNLSVRPLHIDIALADIAVVPRQYHGRENAHNMVMNVQNDFAYVNQPNADWTLGRRRVKDALEVMDEEEARWNEARRRGRGRLQPIDYQIWPEDYDGEENDDDDYYYFD